MSSLLEDFWKEDPLKAADELIQHSNFKSSRYDEASPINVSLLLLASGLLALAKALYGEAGFTLTQYLISSIVLVFLGYIVVGLTLLAFRPYQWVTNRLRSFLTCLIATLTVSLFLVYFAQPIIDVGISFINLFNFPNRIADTLSETPPAILFSAIGCFVIYHIKRRGKSETPTWAERGTFSIYWILTSIIFYFSAYDRGWFFDNVMSQLSKIKLF
jgi:uncharacterized membrane protein SirB2